MTLTKISSKSNPDPIYKIGTLVVDRYNGSGVVSGYKYCKNYGYELPLVRFPHEVIKFSHPECLSIVAQDSTGLVQGQELEPKIFEPPDPDDYLGQSLPLANPILEGIRRLDLECQKLRVEINFLKPYMLHKEPVGTLLTRYCNTASKRLPELRRCFYKKQALAKQKATTLKLRLDLSVSPWLIEPMDGWYTTCYLGQKDTACARDDWLHPDLLKSCNHHLATISAYSVNRKEERTMA